MIKAHSPLPCRRKNRSLVLFRPAHHASTFRFLGGAGHSSPAATALAVAHIKNGLSVIDAILYCAPGAQRFLQLEEKTPVQRKIVRFFRNLSSQSLALTC